MELKRTSLWEEHQRLGAKLVPFAGFEMPVQYQGISQEHLAVRNAAGIFDVSHMGEFIIKGKGALDLVERITTNSVESLILGQAQYSCMTREDGGILDDLLVYRLSEDSFMLVVNASNIEKDWNWVLLNNLNGVEVHNISEKTALLALQGPNSIKILQKITNTHLSDIPYYHFERGEIQGIKNIIISATGYTGAGGFELYFDHEKAPEIWNLILETGKDLGLVPCGLGARDTLRLEMGFCLYGNELNEDTNPLEAGLSWITKLKKDFIGAEFLRDLKKQGIKKKLIGFEILGLGIPRAHYKIKNRDGREIGEVCSGTQSPSLKKGIGMGYMIELDYPLDEPIFIDIREKLWEARIIKPPFI